jgi:molybdate transport system substrate-binding protein
MAEQVFGTQSPGTDYVGSIPPEIQFLQTFSAAIVSGSRELAASQRLLAFLTSERARAAIKASGMEPAR